MFDRILNPRHLISILIPTHPNRLRSNINARVYICANSPGWAGMATTPPAPVLALPPTYEPLPSSASTWGHAAAGPPARAQASGARLPRLLRRASFSNSPSSLEASVRTSVVTRVSFARCPAKPILLARATPGLTTGAGPYRASNQAKLGLYSGTTSPILGPISIFRPAPRISRGV